MITPFVNRKRPWVRLHRREPKILVAGKRVKVLNVRDHEHYDAHNGVDRYITKTYDLETLSGVWFCVEPLGWRSTAHTFFSFQFGDDYLAISVEARRREGQRNPVLWGFLPVFPLLYTATTEKDQFLLRTNVWKHDTYLYRLRLAPQEIRTVFLALVKRLNASHGASRRFNTLARNCTTELLAALEEACPGRLGPHWRRVLTGHIEQYLLHHGLLATTAPSGRLREKHAITVRVKSYLDKGDFSKWIRAELPQ